MSDDATPIPGADPEIRGGGGGGGGHGIGKLHETFDCP